MILLIVIIVSGTASLHYRESPKLRFVDSQILGNSRLDMRIPPLRLQILPESNPPKSRILVRRLARPPLSAGQGETSDRLGENRALPAKRRFAYPI